MLNSQKKKIRFIINPISGIGKQKIAEKLIAQYLDAEKYNYDIAYTNAPKHAIQLAFEAAQQTYYAVIAVGGDGTVNETAQGLLHSNTCLGILPCGSGNGLARHLQIPLNLSEAVKKINHPTIDTLDAGKLNEYYFFNAAGIGFDGYVACLFSKQKNRGFKTYFKVVLKEVFSYPKTKATFLFNNLTINAGRFLNSFCIGSQYGNNIFIAPQANHNDGLFEVVIIDKLMWLKIPTLLYFLAIRKLHKSSLVKIYRTSKITLQGNLSMLHIDGEPVTVSSAQAEISILPKAIQVIR